MANAFLVRESGRRFKVILQISVHEWQTPAESIAEKGLPGPVPSHDGPMLVAGETEECVLKNEAVAETECCTIQCKEWCTRSVALRLWRETFYSSGKGSC